MASARLAQQLAVLVAGERGCVPTPAGVLKADSGGAGCAAAPVSPVLSVAVRWPEENLELERWILRDARGATAEGEEEKERRERGEEDVAEAALKAAIRSFLFFSPVARWRRTGVIPAGALRCDVTTEDAAVEDSEEGIHRDGKNERRRHIFRGQGIDASGVQARVVYMATLPAEILSREVSAIGEDECEMNDEGERESSSQSFSLSSMRALCDV
jgi:hypothetical protein